LDSRYLLPATCSPLPAPRFRGDKFRGDKFRGDKFRRHKFRRNDIVGLDSHWSLPLRKQGWE